MEHEEIREGAIQSVVNMLRTTRFDVEFKVKKRPKGIKVIVEMTQKQMDDAMDKVKEMKTEKEVRL